MAIDWLDGIGDRMQAFGKAGAPGGEAGLMNALMGSLIQGQQGPGALSGLLPQQQMPGQMQQTQMPGAAQAAAMPTAQQQPFAEPPMMMPGFGGNMGSGQGSMPLGGDWRTTMMQSVFGNPSAASGSPGAPTGRGGRGMNQRGSMDRQGLFDRMSQMRNGGQRFGRMPPFGLGG